MKAADFSKAFPSLRLDCSKEWNFSLVLKEQKILDENLRLCLQNALLPEYKTSFAS